MKEASKLTEALLQILGLRDDCSFSFQMDYFGSLTACVKLIKVTRLSYLRCRLSWLG